jgi:hypothetical protein
MTNAIETAIKLLEAFPESTQENLVEELRRLAWETQDDATWDELFTVRSAGLKAAARKARQEIASGQASTLDVERL